MTKPNALIGKKKLHSVVTIQANEDGKLPSEIKVVPVGEWNTEFYGKLQITETHVAEMVNNFNLRAAVPIDVDHDGGKAAGWVKELKNMGMDGLHAVVEWTTYGEKLLSEKIYRLFSPEFYLAYIDPEHGTRHGAVFIAGSLTNRPLFKELPLLASENGKGKQTNLTNDKTITILIASEGDENPMKIEDILAKAKADRSAEEVAFLEEHASEMSDEQKAQVTEENKPADPPAPPAEPPTPPAEPPAPPAEPPAPPADEEVSVKASELERLKKADAELVKAQEKLRKDATEKEITEKFIKADDGMRIAPVQKDALVGLVMKMSEEQKAELYKILASIAPTKITEEIGDDKGGALTASAQIDKLAKDKVKANDKLSTLEAYKQVIAENPELAKKYEVETKGAN